MDTFSAYMRNQAAIASGARKKTFDWDLAAAYIHDNALLDAHAGLDEDWANTRGCIFEDGHPVMDDYTYLSSTWATPTLEVLLSNGEQRVIACWKYEDETDWNYKTKWPKSALDILNGGDRKE